MTYFVIQMSMSSLPAVPHVSRFAVATTRNSIDSRKCFGHRKTALFLVEMSFRPGGNGHPDPEIRGGGVRSPKKTFSALRASVWSKNKGEAGPPGPFPRSATANNFEAKWILLTLC